MNTVSYGETRGYVVVECNIIWTLNKGKDMRMCSRANHDTKAPSVSSLQFRDGFFFSALFLEQKINI